MDNFKRLSMQELYDVEGGIFGVDDAIFWTFVAAGFEYSDVANWNFIWLCLGNSIGF